MEVARAAVPDPGGVEARPGMVGAAQSAREGSRCLVLAYVRLRLSTLHRVRRLKRLALDC